MNDKYIDEIQTLLSQSYVFFAGSPNHPGAVELLRQFTELLGKLADQQKEIINASNELNAEVDRANQTVPDSMRKALAGVEQIVKSGSFEKTVYEVLTHAVNRSILKASMTAVQSAQEDAVKSVSSGVAEYLKTRVTAEKLFEAETAKNLLEASLETQREKNASLNSDVERLKEDNARDKNTIKKLEKTLEDKEKIIRQKNEAIFSGSGLGFFSGLLIFVGQSALTTIMIFLAIKAIKLI